MNVNGECLLCCFCLKVFGCLRTRPRLEPSGRESDEREGEGESERAAFCVRRALLNLFASHILTAKRSKEKQSHEQRTSRHGTAALAGKFTVTLMPCVQVSRSHASTWFSVLLLCSCYADLCLMFMSSALVRPGALITPCWYIKVSRPHF